MERPVFLEKLLSNIDNIHELGRQRAFELGNPFYAKYEGDGEYYTKELPTGERYLVSVEIIVDENDMPVQVKDTVIKQLSSQ
ncbi:hypothetical protein PQ469_18480 [Mucilaginibacter sp. KACC 22773]|jgi:hypothetical protein|uniref:hypothetical protein n=1 Tax=Mucilaginibacter sp. KACC 22773 TaxID=3025671 RepID=UPI002366EB97|nr:hypothetical protein [Mucilaginibacter sp. KACC 22773]WDF75878.1 hypothetical protein PQ469_18480 [Mucilaginibacter sp. KACC 22773]